MPAHIPASKSDRDSSAYRGNANRTRIRKSRKNKAPKKPETKSIEPAPPRVKRRPEWQVIRQAGAERQADALAGLEAARAAAADYHLEISVAMIALSRRAKPTVAHVKFLKAGRVFAHYHPAIGRLFFGRKGKIADEGRHETVEEATTRVIAYNNEHG